jgi:hypothetical protein
MCESYFRSVVAEAWTHFLKHRRKKTSAVDNRYRSTDEDVAE